MDKDKTAVIARRQFKIKLLGENQSKISRKTGIDISTVSRTIRGERRDKDIQKSICSAVGLKHEDLFGKKLFI